MRFSSKEDISAPIDQVYLAVTDFEGFERQALRRGADVQRSDPGPVPGVGSEWRAKFRYRGKAREVKAKLTQMDPPNGFLAATAAGGLEGEFNVDLVSLSPNRTRLHVVIELRAKTLAGRLLVQSLKFAKNTLNKRFTARVKQFAQSVEAKFGHAA